MNSVRTCAFDGVAGAEECLPRIVYLRGSRSWGFVRALSEGPPWNEVAPMDTAARILPSNHGTKRKPNCGAGERSARRA